MTETVLGSVERFNGLMFVSQCQKKVSMRTNTDRQRNLYRLKLTLRCLDSMMGMTRGQPESVLLVRGLIQYMYREEVPYDAVDLGPSISAGSETHGFLEARCECHVTFFRKCMGV